MIVGVLVLQYVLVAAPPGLWLGDAMSTALWTGQPALWQGRACHQTPDDLWNLAEQVWQAKPALLIEVGPGEGGTFGFLHAMGGASLMISRRPDDHVPPMAAHTFVILDGDVYSKDAVWWDLCTYGREAQWLVVCHTMREDWGAGPALASWLPVHPEWQAQTVRHPTRHTWLVRHDKTRADCARFRRAT